MKNLPKLPLEIWLMILKIKRWTERCEKLTKFYKYYKFNHPFGFIKEITIDRDGRTGQALFEVYFYKKSANYLCTILSNPFDIEEKEIIEDYFYYDRYGHSKYYNEITKTSFWKSDKWRNYIYFK